MMIFYNELKCRECERQFDNAESVRRHQRSHNGYEAYVLKWKWNGKRPNCACGCGNITGWNVAAKDYARYSEGHGGKSTLGRARTTEEKLAIGTKNAINTKSYFNNNPEAMMCQVRAMLNALTSDVMLKRAEAVRETYRNLTSEQRQSFRDHSTALWLNQRPLMNAAHEKASSTFKKRAAQGLYDFATRNDNLSKAITKLYLEGGFKWSVGEYTSSKTGEVIFYRSSWELEYAKLLDADNSVATWDYEPFAIKYIIGKKQRNYVPDFLVTYSNGVVELVEVKPPTLEDTNVNRAKRLAALELCNKSGWSYASWNVSSEELTSKLILDTL
jgi:hypothetical protein